MISTLTAAGALICAALSTPCDTPAGFAVALRPLHPDASADWSRRFDAAQYCLDTHPRILIGGMDCVEVATFEQSDGRRGRSFLCRLPRVMADNR